MAMNILAGVFRDVASAENAFRALLDAGIPDDRIGVIVHDSERGATIADDLGREYTSGDTSHDKPLTSRSDVYPVLPQDFIDMTSMKAQPSDALNWYRRELDAGHIVLLVDAADRGDDVNRILRAHGAKGYPMPQERMTERREEPIREMRTTEMNEVRLPIVDEELVVEKTQHQIGEVRVVSETTTRGVDVPTNVMHQEIRVERHKLDRAIHPDEYKGNTGGTEPIRLPIIEEELHVTKVPVVREELIISRIPVTEQRTVHDEVMHSEPDVEMTGTVHVETEEEKRKRRPAA